MTRVHTFKVKVLLKVISEKKELNYVTTTRLTLTASKMLRSALVWAVSLALRTIEAWKTTVQVNHSYNNIKDIQLLPLDEAVASRVVTVIIYRSDGWKRLWSQQNNSKMVRDIPYVSIGELIGTNRLAIKWAHPPTTLTSPVTPKAWGPKSPPLKLEPKR